MNIQRLARLLRLANTHPRDRDNFYRLKDLILSEYATRAGIDYQLIQHECWGCGGPWQDAGCRRCGGTGIYSTVMVRLLRYRLGDCVFHRPDGRVDRHTSRATIVGKIKHPDRRASLLAQISLARIFDRSLYWKWLQLSEDRSFGRTVRRSEQIARSVAASMCQHAKGQSIPMIRLPPAPESDAPF